MGRWFVDTEGLYYDFYPSITDYGIVNLSGLPTDIELYEYEVTLAIF